MSQVKVAQALEEGESQYVKTASLSKNRKDCIMVPLMPDGSAVRVNGGGSTPVSIVSAGSNNATALKATPGQVFNVDIKNVAAYPVYVKFYNKATAPDPSADTIVYVCAVEATASRSFSFASGMTFSAGIGYAIVKGIGATDNTAVLAADVVVSIAYK